MGWKPLEGFKKMMWSASYLKKFTLAANSTETVWMAFAITQLREDGGLDLSGGCLSEKKWLDLWYIWKVELTAFADRWNKEYERKREAKDDSKAFGTRVTFNGDREDYWGAAN